MTEKAIERYLCRQVKLAGGWAMKFTSPGLCGVPDRIVLFPGGRIAFVEAKATGRKPRKLQTHVCDRIRGLGFDVRLIDAKDGADRFIEDAFAAGAQEWPQERAGGTQSRDILENASEPAETGKSILGPSWGQTAHAGEEAAPNGV